MILINIWSATFVYRIHFFHVYVLFKWLKKINCLTANARECYPERYKKFSIIWLNIHEKEFFHWHESTLGNKLRSLPMPEKIHFKEL